MSTPVITYSELSKHPGQIADTLQRTHHLRVTRRDGEDLFLTTASRAQRQEEASDLTARMFAALINRAEGEKVLSLALPEVFPWVRHLSAAELHEFTVDLIAALRDVADLEIFEQVSRVIVEWRATARILADPELTAILTREYPDETHGEVLAP